MAALALRAASSTCDRSAMSLAILIAEGGEEEEARLDRCCMPA